MTAEHEGMGAATDKVSQARKDGTGTPPTRMAAYRAEVDRRHALAKSGELSYLPDGLWLSITENCNFRCVGCYTEGLFKKTYVTPDEVRRMVEGNPGAFRYVSLTDGEAFLHPQLCDIIEICREAQPEALIDLVTNASIPPKGRFRQALTMVDSLGVSIDGACSETYEAIRRGGNFDRFLQNTREIVAIRSESGNPRVLEFSFTAMTTNIGELPEVVRLAAELGIPKVYAQPMEMQDPEIIERVGEFHLSKMPQETLYEITDRARAVGVETGVKVALAGYLRRPPAKAAPRLADDISPHQRRFDVRSCQYPYLKPFQYQRAGERFRVLPCCYMLKSAADVVADRYGLEFNKPRPVAEVYNSKGYWRFRKDLAAGRADDLCGGCMQARTYPWKAGT